MPKTSRQEHRPTTFPIVFAFRVYGTTGLARITRLIGIDLPSNRNRRSVGDRRDHHRCSCLAMSIPHLPRRAAVSSTWPHVSVRHQPPAFRILVYSAPGSQNVASVKDARSIDARERKFQDIGHVPSGLVTCMHVSHPAGPSHSHHLP